MKVTVKATQTCPTLCDPMDCSLSISSVYGILYARILEWVASPFSRGSSQLRDQTQVSCIAVRFFTVWIAKAEMWSGQPCLFKLSLSNEMLASTRVIFVCFYV